MIKSHSSPFYVNPYNLTLTSNQAKLRYILGNVMGYEITQSLAEFFTKAAPAFCSEGDWVPFPAVSWAWMKVTTFRV